MIRKSSTAGMSTPDCELLPIPPGLSHLRFLPVPGYEGRYTVSETGLVRTLVGSGRCPAGGILSVGRPSKTVRYSVVNLIDIHGRRCRWQVHRLVLMAFIGPRPSPVHQVNHKNGHKFDNRVENLEWVTSKENNRHAIDSGLNKPVVAPHYKGELHPLAKLTEDDVRAIRILERLVPRREIAARFGITPQNVTAIWKRRSWTHVV